MRALLNMLLALVISLVLGLGTAWYMIDTGSALTTERIGAWSVWFASGDPKADPYTRAYMARSGRLPITSTSAKYYFAATDDGGRALKSECVYLIEGRIINAAWWSLTLYDATGRLVANKAKRHSFSGHEIGTGPNGNYRIAMGPSLQPGNWLPSGEGKSLRLVLRVYRPRETANPGTTVRSHARLPTISRQSCP